MRSWFTSLLWGNHKINYFGSYSQRSALRPVGKAGKDPPLLKSQEEEYFRHTISKLSHWTLLHTSYWSHALRHISAPLKISSFSLHFPFSKHLSANTQSFFLISALLNSVLTLMFPVFPPPRVPPSHKPSVSKYHQPHSHSVPES